MTPVSGPYSHIVAHSPGMRRAKRLAEQFAAANLPILLVGATGTGKELIAQYIHQVSGRPGDLVDVNCGALPRDMVESLLFGHRRGAFTGAIEDSPGLVAQAAGGTLFLDEVSGLPAEAQVKLLRVFETGEVRRLGDRRKRRIDFRLIAAAQDDLADRVAAGLFRLDLLHRVQGIRIDLPPLSERAEDILPLAAHFALGHGCRLADDVREPLLAHAWPGNVRELRVVIDRAVVFAGTTVVSGWAIHEALQEELPPRRTNTRSRPGSGGRHRPDRHLLDLCAEHDGDRQRIAAALGVSVATLYRRLRDGGVSLRRFSDSHHSHPARENGENSHAAARARDSLSGERSSA